ncbi:major facilitator superfamily domain-containing protein [Cladochytrium replicatum]|nr:major facilitator superfamily domain-containing protein [Cladochytrium replicatum]
MAETLVENSELSDKKEHAAVDVEVSVPDDAEVSIADDAAVARVMRKVDWHVLPILCGFYFFQAIDKGNIGLAQLGGITTDTGTQDGALFNGAVAMFFVGYILLELPSNLILQRVSPRIWVSFIGFAWGLSVFMIGFAKSPAALYMGRFFLGVFEAGILPASLLITATWYPKSEHAFKTAIWFSASSIGSALGGIISYGIQTSLTSGPFHSWSYLMFIEGGFTIAWSILSFVITPDVPERAKFLSASEKIIVVNRLKADRSQTSLGFNRQQFVEALQDYKTWMMALIYFCWQTVNASFSTFGPSIIKGLGFSALNAQLLSSPFAIVNFILQLVISRLSDRYSNRSFFLFGSGVLAIVGYLCIIFYAPNSVTERWTLYGLFVFTSFNPGSLTLILAWTTNLIVGHTKRTVSVTIIVLASAFGGLAGSFVYQASDAPRYITGHTANMIMIVVALITILGLGSLVHRENKKRDAAAAASGEVTKIVLAKDLVDGAFNEHFTDKDPAFRYSL